MATKRNKIREEKTEKTEKKEVNTDGDYTHIAVVLDRSGSMSSTHQDTVGGFESFLKEQKEVEGKATISIYQFDNEYDAICEMQDIQDCVGIKDIYQPRGMTALLDAVGRTINNTDEAIDSMDEEDAPERIICVIITDGGENSSRRFTNNDINDMIAARRDAEWEFVFIGANQDSFSVGGGMGIRKSGSTYDYDATDVGTQALYASLSQGMTSARSKSFSKYKADGFFDDENADADADAVNVDLDTE